MANSVDPDQMLCSAASDLDLHCVLMDQEDPDQATWVHRSIQAYTVCKWQKAFSSFCETV